MITETERIAEGIDLAARLWPADEAERAALLRHLIDEGIASCEQKLSAKREMRLQAIAQIQKDAAFYRDMWPDNWREDQLAGWPE